MVSYGRGLLRYIEVRLRLSLIVYCFIKILTYWLLSKKKGFFENDEETTKNFFNNDKKTLVVGLHPDEATEAIVDAGENKI